MTTLDTRSRCEPDRNRATLVGAVHLLLLRPQVSTLSTEILLLRRHGTGYEDGNYSVPAGHVDPGESAIEACVREAAEEIGVTLKPDDLYMAHVMHRRSVGTDCTNSERVDFFFTAWHWTGDPVNQEPNKCDDLSWFPVTDLPTNTVQYIRDAIRYYQLGERYSESGWEHPCPKCGYELDPPR